MIDIGILVKSIVVEHGNDVLAVDLALDVLLVLQRLEPVIECLDIVFDLVK